MKLSKKLISSIALLSSSSLLLPIASCSCNQKQPANIVAVVITNKPTKLSYAQGEALDLSGLEVKIVKPDGSNEVTTDFNRSIVDKTRLMDKGTVKVTVKLNNSELSDSFNVTVNDAVISKLEITNPADKLVYEQNQKLDLTGLKVKATKSNDEVIDDFKQYTTEPKDKSVLTKWGKNTIEIKADNATTSYDTLVTTEAVDFVTCSWEQVADWTYCYEKEIIDEAFFCQHFKLEETPISHITDLIGQEKEIEINSQIHKVRVIDVCHDEIDSDQVKAGTKATLTFQFANKVSLSRGGYIATIWNDTDNTIDYLNSQIRFNLNKTGDASKSVRWSNTEETKCLFEMLPSEFEQYIWPVKKQVSVKDTSGISIKEYSDRLFLVTPTEFAQTSTNYLVEGTAYKWWSDHDTVEARRASDVGGTQLGEQVSYFTPSTSNSSANDVIAVKTNEYQQDKGFGTFTPKREQSIVPCFCI